MSLVIRRADSKDGGIVLDLIRGLATFEHLLDEVTGTEADLAATLFSSEPRAFCEIAIAFYRKQGATLRKEWIGCRLTGSELEALAAS